VDLLEGVVATLAALPALIVGDNPDAATSIQQIHGILETQEISSARRNASRIIAWNPCAPSCRSRSTHYT
jgi:hypothetical protein